MALTRSMIGARMQPDKLQNFIDPETGNSRAIKCYQKAGFKSFGEIVDDSLMLKIYFEEE